MAKGRGTYYDIDEKIYRLFERVGMLTTFY